VRIEQPGEGNAITAALTWQRTDVS
jgi:hypothetical protein